MGGSLRALAICCLLGLAAAPVRAAEVHLRGHWLQVVDDEDSLVGVLSRDEEGEAVPEVRRQDPVDAAAQDHDADDDREDAAELRLPSDGE